MDITLLSINTWKCDGDYIRRLSVPAAQLKETLRFLSQSLDPPGYYVPARRKTRNGMDSYSGLGVLTRFPIRAILVANIHLTHLRDEDLRRNQYPSFSEPGVVLNRSELGLFPSDHVGFRVQLLCPGYSIS